MGGQIVVPYSKFISKTPGFKVFWRPILDVKFLNQSKSVRASCLVDSGADSTLLNKDYADLLGLKWDSGIKSFTVGINGIQTPTYVQEIDIEIINLKNSRKRIQVGFVDLPIDVLLGQYGFFEHFVVRFKHQSKIFAVDLP